MPDMIKLKNGREVTVDEFYSWSAHRQTMNLKGFSDEAIAKMSASRTGKPQNPERIAKQKETWARKKTDGTNKRKAPVSAETRAKIAAANIGKTSTPEGRAKQNATWAAKAEAGVKRVREYTPLSDDHKAKMSAKLKEAFAAKRAAGFKRKSTPRGPHSEEQRAKISAAVKVAIAAKKAATSA